MNRLLVALGLALLLYYWSLQNVWVPPPPVPLTLPPMVTSPPPLIEPPLLTLNERLAQSSDVQRLQLCDNEALEIESLRPRQQQLITSASALLGNDRPLDWRLLVLLHPEPLPGLDPWLAPLLRGTNPGGWHELKGLSALRQQLRLLSWLAALRRDPEAQPPDYPSISSFLEAPVDDQWQVKHLLLQHADGLPTPLLAAILSQASWQPADLEKLPLSNSHSWPASHWALLFEVIPTSGPLLYDLLLTAEPYDLVLRQPTAVDNWHPLLQSWPSNEYPEVRWPLPSLIDLALLDPATSSSQLTAWWQLGASLSETDNRHLSLPLWGDVAIRAPLPTADNPLPLAIRLPLANYSPDELGEAAEVRAQLEPLLTELALLTDRFRSYDSGCAFAREHHEQQMAHWFWSLQAQGFAPLAELGLNCLNPEHLTAIAEVDPAAAESCRFIQSSNASSSLTQGLPLETWLAMVDNAQASGNMKPLLDAVKTPRDGQLLSFIVSRHLPQLLAPLRQAGLKLTSDQLSWLDRDSARALADAGFDLVHLEGGHSVLQLLATNGELDLDTLTWLTELGVSENSSSDQTDALDKILDSLIAIPERQQLPLIAALQPLVDTRASHWRRMAILRERNQVLYQELIERVPELTPPADIEPRLIM